MKLDFKYLRKKDKLFERFYSSFAGFIKLLRNDDSEFQKLLSEQEEFLRDKAKEVEEFSNSLWTEFSKEYPNIEIPEQFKTFVNANIEELKGTYSKAASNVSKNPSSTREKTDFLTRLRNSLHSIKNITKPSKFCQPIIDIWFNNEGEHRNETINKFLPIDALHSMFMLTPVYHQAESLEQQLIIQEQIPHKLEVEKYTLMMAYINAKYKLGYNEEEVKGRGVFLKFLSENPRGKGNKSLPSWGNLFHNASNHSLGCVVLFRSLCCDTSKYPKNEDAKKIIKDYERKMTETFIFHDGGEEYFREALVAGEMAKIVDADLVKKIYAVRDKFEDFSYKKFTIPKVVNYCKKYMGFSDENKASLKNQMEVATDLNPFEHKLLEVIEKLHTSADIIRMRVRGVQDTPEEILLKFTYVAKHLYGLDLKVDMEQFKNISYDEYKGAIAKILSEAKPNFDKSLIGQVDKSLEGKSNAEQEVLRKRYQHDAKKANEEFKYYAEKTAKKLGFNKKEVKQIEKFISNCEAIYNQKGRK
ncbi:MAG: hypothetical protein SFT90_06425 [Rickettsiales bacterium]|nr:hypothetical protein [Rickettsiales bacterium]